MSNTAGLVDNETPPPQQAAGDNVLVERVRRIGRKRVVANELKELAERQRSVGSNRQSKPWSFHRVHCAI